MPSTRPQFLYPPGSVLMHSPLQLKRANMYGFFIQGRLAQLQASIDGTLNTVAAGRLHYKVLSPFVMLTFTAVSHANSAVPVDYNKGWITETDIITWIMVGRMDEVDGKEKLGAIYWYPFHIWVDDTMALINGRELFGYPKYDCQYTMPALGEDPLAFTLNVKSFKQFSPETQIAWNPLLEVNAIKQGKPAPIKTFLELIEQGIELLLSMPELLNLDADGIKDLLSLLVHPRTDQIFLKQFPDSAGERAVYQAIVAAPANVDALHSGCLLGHEYQLTLHENDSFPLTQSLGVAAGNSQAIFPFNVYFDFSVPPGEEILDNSQIAPEKIAILGGGVGSMVAAFYLTDQPGWQNRYDITVYQMGWRLGGKGASGRNAEYGERIEEHGLHIWFGFYENAFATIQKAYELLQRPPGAPLATWEDAFKPHDYIALEEWIEGQWKTWPLMFPKKPGVPGHSGEDLTLWDLVSSLYAWIKQWIGMARQHPKMQAANHATANGPAGWIEQLASEVGRAAEHLAADVAHLAEGAGRLVEALVVERSLDAAKHALLKSSLLDIRAWLKRELEKLIDGDDELRRIYICIDMGVAIMLGMIDDGVFEHGFDAINDIDFRDWLTKHGANPTITVDSAPVRGFYDLVFAFRDGDFSQPDCEAGTLLRAMLRIGFAYQGSIMWKMQAGMGDTIFTPFYQALKARGVKFKFFHKVEELVPDDANDIGEIRITQQIEVAGGYNSYDPFVYVKGLACWPSTPNYGQLMPDQAALLQTATTGLESRWSNWPQLYQQTFGKPLPTLTLKKGVDFDKVVFGLSVATLQDVGQQLMAKSPALKTTYDKVDTVVTQAYQVWLTHDLAATGFTPIPVSGPNAGQQPVLSAFTEPYDTWAPMDQLLCREDWPAGSEPKNVSYFCSAMPVKVRELPPPSDTQFPVNAANTAKAKAVNQLATQIGALWPKAMSGGMFDWNWLLDTQGGSGPARFDSQYWRANVDPTEQYVLSTVNSTVHRLETDGAGFGNLWLTGDWIHTGLNAGCVEAATMAGMQASRAISGYPKFIKGEKDI